MGQKSGLMGSEFDSRSKDRGFDSHPILDGNGVKAMPGLIPVHPFLVYSTHEKKENIGSKMGNIIRGTFLYKCFFGVPTFSYLYFLSIHVLNEPGLGVQESILAWL